MKKTEQSVALVTAAGREFAVLRTDPQETVTALLANAPPGGMSPFDLDRIAMPASGRLQWDIPTIEGREAADSFVGVILHHQYVRAFWSTQFGRGPSNTPPACYSGDGRKGHGDPGLNMTKEVSVNPETGEVILPLDCATCQWAQFGSDFDGGPGQRCKLIHRLFILMNDSILPVMLSLPPTSVSESRRYMLSLVGRGRPHHTVVTKFGLKAAANANGLAYSKVSLTTAALLTEEQVAVIQQYYAALKPFLVQVQVAAVTTEDYPTGDVAASG